MNARIDSGARLSNLIDAVVRHRRAPETEVWIRETARVLRVIETSQLHNTVGSLKLVRAYYNDLADFVIFAPQHYRKVLSICLDLEDLGLSGRTGMRMVDWALSRDLPGTESNDLARLEASWLMRRRDRVAYRPSVESALRERVLNFAGRADLFAFNTDSSVLVQSIAYLTDFGRLPIVIPDAVKASLRNAGILALLRGDMVQLSEICVASRFARFTPPGDWEERVAAYLEGLEIRPGVAGGSEDAYNAYVSGQWMLAKAGRPAFAQDLEAGAFAVIAPAQGPVPLRELSVCLREMGCNRTGDWEQMRPKIESSLSDASLDVVMEAAKIPGFDAFFEVFARPFETL